ILFRIHDAKKAETRAARIDKYVGMLSRGETPYPRRKAR
ncbi:YdeI/OmpD-associated family protein, partial [Sinorhizobium medicae]